MNFFAAKSTYYFAASSKYTLMSFLVIFLTNSGLNVREAGMVVAIRYTTEVLGAIVMNILTDKFNNEIKSIVIFCTTIAAIIVFSMPWFVYVTFFAGNLLLIFAITSAVAGLFDGGIIATIDAYVIHKSKQISKQTYMKQRIWVSIGLGFTPFLTGVIIHNSERSYFEREALFFVLLVCNICLVISSYFSLSQKQMSNTILVHSQSSLNLYAQMLKIRAGLKHFEVVMVLFSYLCIGIGFVFQYSFIFLLLETELKATKIMMGLGALLQAFAEVLAAPLGLYIKTVFHNDALPLAVSFFGFGSSFLLYYFVNRIYLMIFVNTLIGASYSIFIYPAADILYKYSEHETRGVFYAMAQALLNGVGGCIAGLLGGYLINNFGGRKTCFGGSAMFCVLGLLFTFLSFKRKNETKTNVCLKTFSGETDV